MRVLLFAAAGASVGVQAVGVGPIQKVLQLLEELRTKIVAEQQVEAQQFQAHAQWCTDEDRDKTDAISDGKDKIAQLNAEVQQANADVQEIAAGIEELSNSISSNEKDLESATEVRKAEHKDFVANDKELVDVIDSLVAAMAIIKKNLSLAQGGHALRGMSDKLQKVVTALTTVLEAAQISVDDKSKLMSMLDSSSEDDFMAGGAPEAQAYESHSGSIMEVLGELKEKAEKEQHELRQAEMNAKHNFELLKQNMLNDVEHANDQLKKQQQLSASKAESLGQAKKDLSQTEGTLKDDEKYLGELRQICTAKASEFEARKKGNSEELEALEKAQEILSSDNVQTAAKRLPEGLLQVEKRVRQQNKQENDVREEVANLLSKAADKIGSMGLSQLAVRCRSGDDPFAKVKGMIEQMIVRLMQEAANEADHKAWCDEEMAQSKKKHEKFTDRVDVLTSRVDRAESTIATLTKDISTLQSEMATMDKQQAEATKIRNKEHQEFEVAVKEYVEGQDALGNAIRVLKEYYSKTGALAQVEQPSFDGPVFEGGYEKRADSSQGIIGLLEVAQSDFSRMESEARADESQASREYAELSEQTKVTRSAKSAEVKNKKAELARLENNLRETEGDRASTQKELDSATEYLEKLKGSCEQAPESFESRAAKRQQEIDALREALEILTTEAEAASLIQKPIKRH